VKVRLKKSGVKGFKMITYPFEHTSIRSHRGVRARLRLKSGSDYSNKRIALFSALCVHSATGQTVYVTIIMLVLC